MLFLVRSVSADDITVMTSGAFTAAYLELLPQLERSIMGKVVTATTSMGTGSDSIPSRLARGEAVDVVIVPDETLAQLIKDGLVMADSRVELARSSIGIAVRAGAPKPDISSLDALRRTLLQAKSIAYSASVSGLYVTTELFQRLGIADQVLGKSRRIDRERVGAVVARGEAEIGFQQISELLPVPGVDYVASKNKDAARALIGVLASPEAAVAVAKTGLEPIAATSQQPEIVTTIAFTEGPAVDREGNVYFTDIINQRIMKLSTDGVLSTYRENSNVANGLLIDPQQRLIACEGSTFERPGVKLTGKPRVTRTDLKTGKVEVLADSYEGQPLIGPNDVTIDGRGRLYFTELNGAAVYRIDAPGRLARILSAPEIQSPNGIQISPDDSKLYLVEANQAQGGARMIRSYDLQPDGTVRNMRVHYNFSPGRSADGMSIDTQGNLYASAGLNQLRGTSETLDTKAGVYVISPQGKLLTFIPIAEDLITNNAFGGPDMRTLYVTAGKNLYKVRTATAGLSR
jgi:gluconolactonase